mgnify:CR=1 FL=1
MDHKDPLFRRAHLNLHKRCLRISDFQIRLLKNLDQGIRIRVYDTAQRIGWIVVKNPVVEDFDAREAWDWGENAVVVDIWNTIRWGDREGSVIGLDAVAPFYSVASIKRLIVSVNRQE